MYLSDQRYPEPGRVQGHDSLADSLAHAIRQGSPVCCGILVCIGSNKPTGQAESLPVPPSQVGLRSIVELLRRAHDKRNTGKCAVDGVGVHLRAVISLKAAADNCGGFTLILHTEVKKGGSRQYVLSA
jgi:hypothetical protein